MCYSIEDYEDGLPIGRLNSYSIPVRAGQIFTGVLPNVSLEDNQEAFALQSEGSTIQPTEYIPVGETARVDINATTTPANAGSISGCGIYVRGDAVVLCASPKAGYIFTGWYDDSEELISLNSAYEFSAMEDCTLEAKFTAHTVPPDEPESDAQVYLVNLDATGGTLESYLQITDVDGCLEEILAPVRDGYTFDGWYTAATGGEKVDENYVFTADTTLYAHWTENTATDHTHSWATTWASNANGHWHNCITENCPITVNNQKDGYAAHTSNGGKVTTVPTAYQSGVRTYSCTVCGYVIRTESIPAIGGGIIPGGGSSSSNESSYQIDVSATFNGTVTVTPKSAKSGEKVTIIVTPNIGYVTNNVTVTDRSGNSVAVTNDDNGKYTFTMPASNVTVSATFTAVVPPSSKPTTPAENTSTDETYLLPFTDVLKTDWFYNAVEYVFNNDLMSGTASYTFNPQGKMNRAMVWTVLVLHPVRNRIQTWRGIFAGQGRGRRRADARQGR